MHQRKKISLKEVFHEKKNSKKGIEPGITGRIILMTIGIFLVALALFLLSETNHVALAQKVETVNVGMLFPLSGPGAGWGIAESRVVELKLKEINDAGGWKVGNKIYKFKGFKEDDKYMGSVAAQATARLVHDLDCKVILGSNGSSPYLPCTPLQPIIRFRYSAIHTLSSPLLQSESISSVFAIPVANMPR